MSPCPRIIAFVLAGGEGRRLRPCVFAYDFSTNRVPGVKPHEEPASWRDVGTLEALAEARRDIAGTAPRFDLCATPNGRCSP